MYQKSIIFGNKKAELAIAISSQIRSKNNQNQQTIDNLLDSQQCLGNEKRKLIKINFDQSWVNLMYSRQQKLTPLSGKLYKKSPLKLMGYQEKYCKLEDRVFSYYKSENPLELEGSLDFDLQEYEFREIQNERNLTIKFSLIPNGGQKEFIFKAQKPETTHQWALQIKIQLSNSIGNQKQLRFLVQIPKFWKNSQIKNAKVLNECQDGDIALFKSKNSLTKVARAILRCEYDHVCLLYRDNGQLYVFEAVQSGVGTFPWTYLVEQKWVDEYEKVCIRKLNYVKKESPDVQNNLKNFISENLGCQYSLDPIKLLQTVSYINPKKPEAEGQTKRTYFCSELVAKSYKQMGLLDPVKSSTQYYPSDFTSEKKLQLLDGASLEAEQLVIFEL